MVDLIKFMLFVAYKIFYEQQQQQNRMGFTIPREQGYNKKIRGIGKYIGCKKLIKKAKRR